MNGCTLKEHTDAGRWRFDNAYDRTYTCHECGCKGYRKGNGTFSRSTQVHAFKCPACPAEAHRKGQGYTDQARRPCRDCREDKGVEG